jgi:glycosyltransferase involved in cell wall biosynthesis
VNVGIHQVLVAASPGDAITNMARSMQRLLRQVGPSEIFAQHIAPALLDDVQPLSRYRAHHSRSILIFHASIGQPEVHQFLMERHEPIVLVYHNVTPPSYFERYDMVFAELLSLGRRDVDALRPRVAAAIAASEFNARELEAMGYRNVRVVPPAIDLRHLTLVEPRESTAHHLEMLGAPKLLCIAQLMPHKRPDFLVQTMHVAETYLGMRGFLLLVGPQRLERYARAIREQIQELNLVGVHLVGAVDDADLAAMLRAASVVVTASEHEGFCMPLVEAMTFDTPVIARACAAIPETVGDAGLLLPAPAGPTLFAEAITELLSNKPLQAELVARGRRRVADLESHPPDAAILETVLAVA